MFRHIRNATCTALVVAAVIPVPSAIAQQDLRHPDTRDAAERSQAAEVFTYRDLRSPDARDAAERSDVDVVYSARDLRSPDARDAARGIHTGTFSQSPVPVDSQPGGFDWGDAGIGAVGGLALLAILGGASVLATQRRRQRVHVGMN